MLIAFDIDGCLLDTNDQPREEVIALLKALSKGNSIVIWSGGGIDYVNMWVDRLQLRESISTTAVKAQFTVDLAIDDQEVKLGKFNLRV